MGAHAVYQTANISPEMLAALRLMADEKPSAPRVGPDQTQTLLGVFSFFSMLLFTLLSGVLIAYFAMLALNML